MKALLVFLGSYLAFCWLLPAILPFPYLSYLEKVRGAHQAVLIVAVIGVLVIAPIILL